MRLGAHLSIAEGIENALKDAKTIGANTLQIFSGSPRSWEFLKRSSIELKRFRDLAKKNDVSPIFVHAKYLVNLSSQDPQIRQKSINSLIEDLDFCQKTGASGVIFHPHPQNLSLLTKSIEKVLASTPKSTYLILENSAQIKLEKIGEIIKVIKNSRLKFCLDTAHAYQAGYDLAKEKGVKKVFGIIKTKIGFERWVVIHANDSKTDLGSRHDQHENIAQGKLGALPFTILLQHPVSKKLPFILETPAIRTESLPGGIKNLNTLRKLSQVNWHVI
ncbi:deoxyribonuclease IV [Candidatus Shapirobacteria bacterium]|nr:deoxyribonuclease IV [Candidatus Shapirobacteria bacterium]